MNLDDLTLGQARQLASLFCKDSPVAVLSDCPWEVGSIYLIRTVTMIDTGRLVAVTPQELVIEDAAWIADTGRFADALKSLSFNEIEPFPDGKVIIGRGSIIDAIKITKTQRSQK